MYSIIDKEIFIRAREEDIELIEAAAEIAAAEFEQTAGFHVETEIDYDNCLGSHGFVPPYSRVDQ